MNLDKLIAVFGKDLDLAPEEIADILWLTLQRQETGQTNSTPSPQQIIPPATEESDLAVNNTNISSQLPKLPTAKIYSSSTTSNTSNAIPLRIPDAPSLRTPLTLAQSLRPLMRRVASDRNIILDETATVDYFANQRIIIPIFKPEPEPWLDLALVVDESKSMLIWRHTIYELKRLLEHYGVFRDVRTYSLVVNNANELQLRPEIKGSTQRLANPNELIDTTGRRLILVVSDCITSYWRDGSINSIFKLWTTTQPVAIIQMLPQWLWSRTGLNSGASVRLGSLAPGVTNQQLLIKELLLWKDIELETGIKIPVLTLEPETALTWSQVVAGKSDATAPGFVFAQKPKKSKTSTNRQNQTINAEERVHRFRMTASPIARKLASLLAAAPVINLPVVRLIQETILPESQQVNVAEVFLGGLLKPIDEIQPETNPDTVQYSFMDDTIRNIFLNSAPVSDSADVFNAVSKYICSQLGKSLSEFVALLKAPNHGEEPGIKAFAEVSSKILKRLGGDYAKFAEELKNPTLPTPGKGEQEIELQTFSFETVTVNRRGAIIKRETHSTQYFTENIGNVTLDMVAIPGGTFLMGAPENEEKSYDDERPQHEVTIQPFFIGKYPITQAQWRAVAALQQVNRELKPEPSHFKGDNLPVEQISWYDAVEFCDRLTKHSGRNYRLPSEAEWEYACRAGTSTPFHFGETITSELVNFDGTQEPYADAAKGEYREKTTNVGSFSSNAFGLHDMHGNVWEWCADDWHENYLNAPDIGITRIDKEKQNKNDNDNQKLLRGGAWNDNPRNCRSAYRLRCTRDLGNFDGFGFRVVCGGAARIL